MTAGLDTISAAVAVLAGDEGPQTVTVSATDGMSLFWLQPLIDSFRSQHPDIGFVVLASDADDTLRNYSEVDIAILCGNERCEVGEELHFLFQEIAQPVCSPGFLAEHGPFDTADAFNRGEPSAPARPALERGRHRLAAAGLGGMVPRAGRRMGQGAVEPVHEQGQPADEPPRLRGEGVMLGWHHMVRAPIAEGRMVFAHPAPITAGRGNFLNCKKKSLKRPGCRGLCRASAGGDAGAGAGLTAAVFGDAGRPAARLMRSGACRRFSNAPLQENLVCLRSGPGG
ncbi:LysR substrate-binding domain-containing protein (plasmid) [Paracoccus sp. MA]|uniref:LysR substrate-binding domain-containing protein n=1 Tax=Paracoccus sp. MA TaxID=2895796 RepID=UPI001E3EAD66|nr:LysR substrate-binding domain-containing protein [Paracoccus sp. MA]UFM67186.1 LysR substrate-binding domain-containing protein [Paracoccus sp. MA]